MQGVRQLVQQSRSQVFDPLARLGEAVHRAGTNQRLVDAPVHAFGIGAQTKVVQVLEGTASLALGDDRGNRPFANATHRAESVEHFAASGREAIDAGVHVGRAHLQLHAPRLVHQFHDVLDDVHVCGQRGGHELRRIVELQPRGLEGQDRVGRCVGLVEGIAGELLHLVEEIAGEAAVDAVGIRAGQKHGAHFGHFLRLLLGHGAAQQVRLAQRETGQQATDVHHLLLIEDDAVGAVQRRLQARVGIFHPRSSMLAIHVVVNRAGLQRAGAKQRHQGDDVVDGIGQKTADEVFHAPRFELEHRLSFRLLQKLVGGGFVQRHRFDVDGFLACGFALGIGGGQRPVDDGEGLEAKQIEFDEARFLHVVQIELRHHGTAALIAVEGYEIRQRCWRDHHAAGVLAGVSHHAFQLVGHVHDFRGVLVAFDEVRQGFFLVDGFGERHAHVFRNHLGQPFRQAVRLVLNAGDVAHHLSCRHGAEGDDQTDRIEAVALCHVGDDALAPFHAEVDVEIGHRHPFRVQQAFEKQVVLQRIQFGDA